MVAKYPTVLTLLVKCVYFTCALNNANSQNHFIQQGTTLSPQLVSGNVVSSGTTSQIIPSQKSDTSLGSRPRNSYTQQQTTSPNYVSARSSQPRTYVTDSQTRSPTTTYSSNRGPNAQGRTADPATSNTMNTNLVSSDSLRPEVSTGSRSSHTYSSPSNSLQNQRVNTPSVNSKLLNWDSKHQNQAQQTQNSKAPYYVQNTHPDYRNNFKSDTPSSSTGSLTSRVGESSRISGNNDYNQQFNNRGNQNNGFGNALFSTSQGQNNPRLREDTKSSYKNNFNLPQQKDVNNFRENKDNSRGNNIISNKFGVSHGPVINGHSNLDTPIANNGNPHDPSFSQKRKDSSNAPIPFLDVVVPVDTTTTTSTPAQNSNKHQGRDAVETYTVADPDDGKPHYNAQVKIYPKEAPLPPDALTYTIYTGDVTPQSTDTYYYLPDAVTVEYDTTNQPAAAKPVDSDIVAYNETDPSIVAIVCAVNRERQNAGLAPLLISVGLNMASNYQATFLYYKRVCSHIGPNGNTMQDRIGYYCPNQFRANGENVALGQTSVTEVMHSWMASEGHRKNILNPIYKMMGAARIGDAWAQDFGDMAQTERGFTPDCSQVEQYNLSQQQQQPQQTVQPSQDSGTDYYYYS